MLKVGLTGGIGSGKSVVARMFMLLGVPVFNSDVIAKEIVIKDAKVKQAIIDLLGPESYNVSGDYNRQYVSSKVFSDTQLLQQLNGIIHPAVAKSFDEFCEEHKAKKYIIKEAAILIETGIYTQLDKLILVVAPEYLKIQRVLQRDNTDASAIAKRMKSQWSDEQKLKYADFIIKNDELELVIPQVLEVDRVVGS